MGGMEVTADVIIGTVTVVEVVGDVAGEVTVTASAIDDHTQRQTQHTYTGKHNTHNTHTHTHTQKQSVSYFLLIHKQTFFLMMIQHGKTLTAGQKQTVRFNNIVTRQYSS